ncbi:MAG: DOMON domain-containing protein [Spirochaetes bacterium]|nr:DOMON domain-containing protein [Spirochaetota bacterium]
MLKKMIYLILIMTFTVSLYSSDQFQTLESRGISFSWRIVGENLEVIVKAKTTGWLSVGFNPSKRMKDADYIIGYIKKGQVFISDDFGIGLTMHTADEKVGGKNNIISSSGTEKDGFTEIQFMIPLNSGDKYDQVIGKGTHKVILAYGLKDDYTSKHVMIGSVEMIIP